MMPHPDDLLRLYHREAGRQVSDRERLVRSLRRAHRMQRWADRLARASQHMSRLAQVRVARLHGLNRTD
jgi:hypothetical protein